MADGKHLEFLRVAAERNALLVVVLLIMLIAAILVLRRFRDSIDKGSSSASDLMMTYREMHEQGVISDAEYRTIKNRLRARLHKELPPAGVPEAKAPETQAPPGHGDGE